MPAPRVFGLLCGVALLLGGCHAPAPACALLAALLPGSDGGLLPLRR